MAVKTTFAVHRTALEAVSEVISADEGPHLATQQGDVIVSILGGVYNDS